MKTPTNISHITRRIVKTSRSGVGNKSAIKRRDLYAMLGVVVIIAILVGGAQITQNITSISQGKGIVTTTTVNTSQGGNLCTVTKPLAVTEIDALGGSAFNAPTGTLYNGVTQLESPTFSSSGLGTTGGRYVSGTSLGWQFSGASQATEFVGGTNNIPFIVPPQSCGDVSTNNVLTVYGITLDTWTITVAGAGGTTFTNGGRYFFSQFPGGSSGTETITVNFSPVTANQGSKASYDFINGLWQNFIVEMKDTGSSLSITGLPRQINFGGGTTRYWPVACPDGLSGAGYGSSGGSGILTVQSSSGGGNQQSVGTYDAVCQGSVTTQKIGTVTYGGNGVTISLGVSKGALGAASSETLSISGFKYGDYVWFTANGVYGPNAAQVGSAVGAAANTSFTIIFNNS